MSAIKYAVTRIIIMYVATVFFAGNCAASEKGFSSWLEGLKAEALTRGIRQQTLDLAFFKVKPNDLVLKLDRNQPEFTLTLGQYLERVVSPTRVRKGVDYYKKYADPLLTKVTSAYGVQGRFLIALWGVETDFSRVMGSFPVVESLATLAYDPRRSEFFRKELFAALHIVDTGRVALKKLEGSWAGAFGGLQFLPSVYKEYAVDFNGDGVLDISDNADLFASGAHYLASVGWTKNQTWGREVILPDSFGKEMRGLDTQKKIMEWQQLGLTRPDGGKLPGQNLLASVIVPDASSGRAFIVYNNFRMLLKWNRSLYYATAVGLLSDAIASAEDKGIE